MHTHARAPIRNTSPSRSTFHPEILLELVQNYGRPAAVTNEAGEVLCVSDAGTRPGDAERVWPRRAKIIIGDEVFYLALPAEDAAPAPSAEGLHIPPRLSKVARLVIAGYTDKQIATRTGLSFSTVRTYVRQLYHRTGVHNRVELVHASRIRPIIYG